MQLSRHLHHRFVVFRKGSLYTIKSAHSALGYRPAALEDNSHFYASTSNSTSGIIIEDWPDLEKLVGVVLTDG